MFRLLLSVALGGALGALLRYGVSGLAYKWLAGIFPYGTLTVNTLGSFLIGFLWPFFQKTTLSPEWRAFVLIGTLGAFTTFSTFSLETLQLIQDGELKLSLLNVTLNLVLALAAVFLGFWLARVLFSLLK